MSVVGSAVVLVVEWPKERTNVQPPLSFTVRVIPRNRVAAAPCLSFCQTFILEGIFVRSSALAL